MATRQTKAPTGILSSLKGGSKAPDKAAEKVTIQADSVEIVTETVEVTAPETDAGQVTDEAAGTVAETVSAAGVATDGAFDWDTLPAAEVAVYSRAPIRVDLDATTPAFIKDRVSFAFAKTQAEGVDSKGRPKAKQVIQNCGTPERAEEFLKLARKYATFKDYTLRGDANPVKIATGDGTFISGAGIVSFAVKPKETRKRVEKPAETPVATDEKPAE